MHVRVNVVSEGVNVQDLFNEVESAAPKATTEANAHNSIAKLSGRSCHDYLSTVVARMAGDKTSRVES